MKKIISILLTICFSTLLNGCLVIKPQRISSDSQYSQTEYLIDKAGVNQTSVDELCKLLDNIDDPVLSLSCDDDGKGTVSFTKLAFWFSIFPIPLIFPEHIINWTYQYNINNRLLNLNIPHEKKDFTIEEMNDFLDEKYDSHLKNLKSGDALDYYEHYFHIGDFRNYFSGGNGSNGICLTCW